VTGPITAVILTGEVTPELRRSVPILLKAGFKVLVGVTAKSVALDSFIAEYNLGRVDVPWTGDFSEAFNLLFDRVIEGTIVRIDNDEWMPVEQAEALVSWIRGEEPPFVGTLVSRNLEREGSLATYAESRVLRLWPADALLQYFYRVHERPRQDAIDKYLAGKPMSQVPVYYWHSGYVLERRKEKGIRDAAAIRLILEEHPDSLFFHASLASALMDIDPVAGLAEFHDCASRLIAHVKQEKSSRVPAEGEMIIAQVLAHATPDKASTSDYVLLEQIGLRQFDRSFPVIWGSVALRIAQRDYEAALYFALRAKALHEAGRLSLSIRANPTAIAEIPSVVDQLFNRVPQHVLALKNSFELSRFALPDSA